MGEYLKVTKVEVVQAVDLEELDKTLKWLVSKVQQLPEQADTGGTIADGLLQAQVDALRKENAALKDNIAQLQARQDDLASRLDTMGQWDQSKPDGSSAPGADAADGGEASADGAGNPPAADSSTAASSPASTGDLERRVAALEQRMGTSGDATAAAADGAAAGADADADADAAGADGADAAPAGPDLGSQLQELIAGHRALAATVSGLQHEVEAKPSRGELDAKANRSELDALLRAGVSPGAGAGAAPALEVADDGSVNNAVLVEAVNQAGSEVASVRAQVAVLLDRMDAKAEQGALEDLAAQLASLKARGGITAAAPGATDASAAPAAAAPSTPSTAASVPAAVSKEAFDDVVRRLGDVEVKVAAGAAAAPAAAASAEQDGAAVDAIGRLEDVQPLLKDLFTRVDAKAERSALEDALHRLQELASALDGKADAGSLQDLTERLAALSAAAPAAAGAAANGGAGSRPGSRPGSKANSKPSSARNGASAGAGAGAAGAQQWVVSHEITGGDAGPPAGLDELRAQVADLAARVAKLAAAGSAAAAAMPPPSNQGSLNLRASQVGDLDTGALQAALAGVQAHLGELATRLAGKADAGELARIELALNSKAELDELAELRMALGGKADAPALAKLEVSVAGKADQAALDEVKLLAAIAADVSAAGSGGGDGSGGDGAASGGSGGGGFSNLLTAVQGMVADKAGKAELGALQDQVGAKASSEELGLLRAAVDDKANAAELTALVSQLSGRAANADEIASLDQRMGDVFTELAKIRADMAALPAEALAAAGAAGAMAGPGGAVTGVSVPPSRDGGADGSLGRMVSALSREVGQLREGLDAVAHAANVLAVGMDGPLRASNPGGPASAGGVEARYSDAGGAGGKENRSPRGGYERLVKLLGSGEYRHKMDAFDPTALQQMAQKVAFLEATMKSPAMGRIGAGGAGNPGGLVDYGIKELERQVKRLGTDVRLMKDKLVNADAFGGGGTGKHSMAPGDHAMLAARPITGYRCMACDRPLNQLDNEPGPFIPTNLLPMRGAPAADSARGVRSGRPAGGELSPQASSSRVAQFNMDPNVRAVQNWYKDQSGPAAEALPPQHVGPHLPPGGWRPSNPGTARIPGTQNSLPNLNAPKARGSPAEPPGPPLPPAGMPAGEGAVAPVTLPQIS
ncbi:hypothetical protein HYH03_002716 [Edaphochlamys debaryana]|uniref:Uncharacterized protein n=1 Tax=Edaphochlamys debaryana TaxID=47281 RepID=A0A835YD87_9CHLO|nr:hypothetical protein HYH03_002716 [Edaphochlamys debaryana]|eukprot:KAG2499133.1 hypothetical protein HYH03_002716 [Edaphochlamys debaryana]